jgi:hypothetical protein
MTYENEHIEEEIHIYAATLLDPAHVLPSRHVFVDEQLSWFEGFDDLPRFAGSSRGTLPIRVGPRTHSD